MPPQPQPVSSSPLAGKRLLLTRPDDLNNASFVAALTELGATVIQVPLIETRPALTDWPDWSAFDWLFLTSKNAVSALPALSSDDALSIACVGPATEEALRAKGLPARFVSSVHEAESAARSFIEQYPTPGLRVLWPCGNLARPTLKNTLEAAGIEVTTLTVYETTLRTTLSAQEQKWLAQPFDMLVFTSGSAVNAFQQAQRQRWNEVSGTPVACLGPQTAQTAQATFGHVEVQAAPHTLKGLQQAIQQFFNT